MDKKEQKMTTAYILIVLPILRNMAGWLENSLKDGTITKYEWRRLVATVVKLTALGVATMFGLEGLGVEQAELIAAGAVYLFDVIESELRK